MAVGMLVNPQFALGDRYAVQTGVELQDEILALGIVDYVVVGVEQDANRGSGICRSRRRGETAWCGRAQPPHRRHVPPGSIPVRPQP